MIFNPSKVPASKVPPGWRFLREDELGERGTPQKPSEYSHDRVRPHLVETFRKSRDWGGSYWGPICRTWGAYCDTTQIVEDNAPPKPKAPSRWPKWDKLVKASQ